MEIENKGESSIVLKMKKLFLHSRRLIIFLKYRFPENKISKIFSRESIQLSNILRKIKITKPLMSFDKYKLLEISDNESEIINKTEPTNLELLTSLEKKIHLISPN